MAKRTDRKWPKKITKTGPQYGEKVSPKGMITMKQLLDMYNRARSNTIKDKERGY